MKNFLKYLLLLCFLFITPIYANETYTLQVNGISYQTTTSLISKNDTIYISLSDLAKISFSEVTQDEDTYTFNFQDKTYQFKPHQQTFKATSKSVTLAHPTFLVNETLYVPIEVLKHIGYTHSIDSKQQIVSLTCPTIYSRNSDMPNDHTYIASLYNLKDLPKHILSFGNESTLEETVIDAISNKHYISFLDNSNSSKVIEYFRSRLGYAPYNNIFVSYRIIDTHTYPNQIIDTVTLPLKIDFYGSTLRLTLGDKKWTYPTIWPAFYPTYSLTEMDLQKSIDSTLMHALYEDYRNTSDLKDDKYFSPFSLITSERTNEMVHNAYSLSYSTNDSLTEYETPYTVHIQRVHPSGKLHYIIDIQTP